MEVDAHPPRGRQTAGGAALATTEVPVLNGEAYAHSPKVFREECMRLSARLSAVRKGMTAGETLRYWLVRRRPADLPTLLHRE